MLVLKLNHVSKRGPWPKSFLSPWPPTHTHTASRRKYAYACTGRSYERMRSMPSRMTHWLPGRFELNCRWMISKLILVNDGWGNYCEITLVYISLGLIDDKPKLGDVMACCRHEISNHLSRCWPDTPHGVTGQQMAYSSRPMWYTTFYGTTTMC